MASTNLLLNNSAPLSKDCDCKTLENEMEDRNVHRRTTEKVDTEPVVVEFNSSIGTRHQDLTVQQINIDQEEESAYFDIHFENDASEGNQSVHYFSENNHQLYSPSENESSFIEARPSLTQEEILLLYAKVDKTKKIKYRNSVGNPVPDETNETSIEDSSKRHIATEGHGGSFSRSTAHRIQDFHPKKVNELHLPKTVVEVTLNEYFIEHSRIRCQEKNTTYVIEDRPLPALPKTLPKNENSPDQDEETESHIYATLPSNKS